MIEFVRVEDVVDRFLDEIFDGLRHPLDGAPMRKEVEIRIDARFADVGEQLALGVIVLDTSHDGGSRLFQATLEVDIVCSISALVRTKRSRPIAQFTILSHHEPVRDFALVHFSLFGIDIVPLDQRFQARPMGLASSRRRRFGFAISFMRRESSFRSERFPAIATPKTTITRWNRSYGSRLRHGIAREFSMRCLERVDVTILPVSRTSFSAFFDRLLNRRRGSRISVCTVRVPVERKLSFSAF